MAIRTVSCLLRSFDPRPYYYSSYSTCFLALFFSFEFSIISVNSLFPCADFVVVVDLGLGGWSEKVEVCVGVKRGWRTCDLFLLFLTLRVFRVIRCAVCVVCVRIVLLGSSFNATFNFFLVLFEHSFLEYLGFVLYRNVCYQRLVFLFVVFVVCVWCMRLVFCGAYQVCGPFFLFFFWDLGWTFLSTVCMWSW